MRNIPVNAVHRSRWICELNIKKILILKMALRGLFYFLKYFFKLLITPCQRHVIYRWNEVSPLHCVPLVCFATLRTASTETYDDLEIKTRGLFVCWLLYIIYSKNTNKMLPHFKNAANPYLRNFLRNSKRIVHDEPLTLLY